MWGSVGHLKTLEGASYGSPTGGRPRSAAPPGLAGPCGWGSPAFLAVQGLERIARAFLATGRVGPPPRPA
eukprot:8484474-Alexandrium_andersonii.AAC.1